MASQALVKEFQRLLGTEQVLLEETDRATYAYDAAVLEPVLPAIVLMPRSAEDLGQVVRLCQENALPLTVRGAGTNLSGGTVPGRGGAVVLTTALNKILEINEADLYAVVQPGVVTARLAGAVEAKGLFYPPDPGSMAVSTLGGNVAENAGGLRGLKYGVTRDYVMGLEVVLADGEVITLGNKCVKDVAGYSMKDIFIGSEGTLGIIAKVLLQLVPKPAAKKTLLATFSEMDAAAETVSAIIAAKIIPCTLEFLDKITIRCVEEYAHVGLPLDAEAVLLMETDGHPAVVQEEAQQMAEIARRNGATGVQLAQTPEEATLLATARRVAFSALARVAPTTILEDATVPRSELANMIRFIQQVAGRAAPAEQSLENSSSHFAIGGGLSERSKVASLTTLNFLYKTFVSGLGLNRFCCRHSAS